MENFFQLGVRDAESLASNGSDALDGEVAERKAKGVSPDHSSRAHNDETVLAGRWSRQRCRGRYLVIRCHDTSRFSIQRKRRSNAPVR